MTLIVEAGRNLRPPGSRGLCDALVSVRCGSGNRAKTSKSQKKTNNPRWHFQVQAANTDPSEVVVIEVSRWYTKEEWGGSRRFHWGGGWGEGGEYGEQRSGMGVGEGLENVSGDMGGRTMSHEPRAEAEGPYGRSVRSVSSRRIAKAPKRNTRP